MYFLSLGVKGLNSSKLGTLEMPMIIPESEKKKRWLMIGQPRKWEEN